MSNFRRKRLRDEPIDILEFNDETAVEEEQKFEHIFSNNGKKYYLWTNPPPSVGLEYIAKVKETSQEAAVAWLLEQMLGEDGFKALRNVKGLRKAQLEQIMEICKEYAMGDDESGITGN